MTPLDAAVAAYRDRVAEITAEEYRQLAGNRAAAVQRLGIEAACLAYLDAMTAPKVEDAA